MSVELPPPQVPQAVALAQVQTGTEQVAVTTFQGRQVQVSGAPLAATTIDLIFGSAQSLDQALRDLTAACFGAGYPAARVLYAEAATGIHIAVQPGRISSVHAVAPLQPYFENLTGADPLTDGPFETARVLASLHADRAGIYSVPHFVSDGNGGMALELIQDDRQSPYQGSLEMNNHGNRFVGRYFANAEFTAGDPWGDELTLAWLEGLSGLDHDDSGADSYHGPSANLDRVTPWGVFGIKARYATYDYTRERFTLFGLPDDQPLTGKLLVPAVSWLYLLRADFDRRWTLMLLADHTDNSIERSNTGEKILDEVYSSVELASSFVRKLRLAGAPAELESALTVRKGFGGTGTGMAAAELDYLLFRPTLRFEYSWNERWVSHFNTTGQFSNDHLPEQEQFVLGGMDNLMAYLPGVAAGDKGLIGMVDTQYRCSVWGLEFKPRIFAEYGASAYSSTPAGQSSRQSLADAGIELGWRLAPHAEAAISSAWPLHDEGIRQTHLDAAESNVYFTLKLEL